MKKKNLLLLAILTWLVMFQGAYTLKAQDPTRFQSQVTDLANARHHPSPSKQFVLFTGSSSVRMWTDVQSYFPGYFIVNNGFGGSHFFEFADVWEAMTDENGEVFKDVFLKDDLHMNKKGYDIWGKVMGQFLN